jgi:hypothetical protein
MGENAKKERRLSGKSEPSVNQEVELFRQIIQDERDYYERLKDNEPQDPDK